MKYVTQLAALMLSITFNQYSLATPWYIGFDAGYQDIDGHQSFSVTKNHALNGTLFVGLELTDWLSLQSSVISNSEFEIDARDYQSRGLDFSLKPTLQIDEHWSLYSKVGLLAYDFRSGASRDQSVATSLAAGLQYHVNKNIILTSAVQRFEQIGNQTTGEVNITSYNIGMIYRFTDEEPVYEKPIEQEVEPIVEPMLLYTEMTTDIHFSHDSSVVSDAQSRQLLQLLADTDLEKIINIRINGYSNSLGSKKYNYDLSRRRAYSLEKLIHEKVTDNIGTIDVNYYGESNLKYKEGKEDLDESRRTEIIIFYSYLEQ